MRILHLNLCVLSSNRKKKLAIYVIDKLHIKGHTETWCKQNCHPQEFPELKDVNTIICEQVNYWSGKYKYMMKLLNSQRLFFFCMQF